MELPITLIGFMGSGKSTIGKQIAHQKNIEYIDLDKYIHKSTGKSITSIFENEGEEQFREIESRCLREVLAMPNHVISLGGGTPCFFDNLEMIKTLSTSVYLQVSAEGLTRRLTKSTQQRPLIKGKSQEELLVYIQGELVKREKYYLQADFVIQSDQIRVEDLLSLIFS